MDLKRLNHLVALADSRNFGRAAVQCHLTQSAFSRSIQAAEDELGLLLFDRGTLEVTCTDAGAFVVERARKLLFESRCLERDVSLYRERLIGDLAFGAGPYAAAALLPPLLKEIRQRFPAVKLRVEVNNADYLAEHLRAEELDFYLADVRNVVADPDLSVTRMAHLPAGFYVRPGHPLLTQRLLSMRELMGHGIVSVRVPDVVLLGLGRMVGLPEGERMSMAVECDDLNLLKSLTMESDSVMASADAGVAEEVASGRLVRLAVKETPALFSDMAAVALRGRSFSLMAQFAIDFLAQQLQGQMRPH